MLNVQVKVEQLLDAVLQMPEDEFQQFVNKLFVLRARRRAPVLAEREAELLEKISQCLPPAVQARLNGLIKKRRAETITDDELQELIRMTNEVELFDAKRLEHLIELAHLRNVPLKKLIKQLGLKPVRHD